MKRRFFDLRNRLYYTPGSTELNIVNTKGCIEKGEFDIFHPTYYNPYFIDCLGNKPFCITIHDMIPEKYPEFFPGDETLFRKKELIEKADLVFAVSEQTKTELMKFYSLDEKKVSVIYHWIEPLPAEINDPAGLPEKFLLFVGNRGAYKNFPVLLYAFAELYREHRDLHLVCVGEDFSIYERQLMDHLALSGHIHVIKADPVELHSIYRKALAYISPSLDEGFNIPVIEAFQNNCPVVLSDIAIHKEIAGDAALYFEAKEFRQLAEVLAGLLKSGDLREELCQKATTRLSRYNKEKCLALYADAYKSMV